MKRIVTAVSVAAMLAGVTAFAQPGGRGGMGGPPGMSANMAQFFGENQAFTAKVQLSVINPSQSGPMALELEMSMLDGKIRMETDLSKMKGGGIPPSRMAQMKQMGMDKSVNIIRPDLKITYAVFPGLHAYFSTPMSDKQVSDAMDKSKIEKTSLGKETIDGHACEKNKLVVSGNNGEKHEVLVWNETDLKDFPVQIQMDDDGGKTTMKFTEIKLEKPDAKLLAPPADFTKYDDFMSLMQGEMMKRAGGGSGAPK
jgi:hypothetical protein